MYALNMPISRSGHLHLLLNVCWLFEHEQTHQWHSQPVIIDGCFHEQFKGGESQRRLDPLWVSLAL